MNIQKQNREYRIVLADQEEILRNLTVKIRSELWPSFRKVLENQPSMGGKSRLTPYTATDPRPAHARCRRRATENMAVDTRPLACTIVENKRHQIEVCTLAETQQNPIPDLVSQARERLAQELHAQAEQLEKVEQNLQELRNRHQQLETALQQQLDALAKVELPAAPAPAAAQASLEQVLAAVRELITATLPEQVLDVLTDAAEQLGARAAVFDVRGKAAWGSSARGFGAGLTEKIFRGLVVPLSHDNPFRTCYETGGHVDASVELLKKNRNVLDKLRPSPDVPIVLLPVRSAGSVSAIFYADAGGARKELPVDALKILTEFAGAQLDRLMAFSGGAPAEAVRAEAEAAEAVTEEAARGVQVEVVEVEPVEAAVSGGEVSAVPVLGATIPVKEAVPPPPPLAPPVGQPAVAAPPVVPEAVVAPPPPPAPAVGFDISQLSEADQKVHRDAKRFAKLLISEIELYNKAKVTEGRKTGDLYRRLKSDIDRSRQTYEKRFGKTVTKQYDYFHEELVRTLAGNESSLLGSEYPGPSV
jgi:chaperonin cofactor prefoldin